MEVPSVPPHILGFINTNPQIHLRSQFSAGYWERCLRRSTMLEASGDEGPPSTVMPETNGGGDAARGLVSAEGLATARGCRTKAL
jgi:hypothetical protein